LNHYYKQVAVAESSGALTDLLFTEQNAIINLFKFNPQTYYDASIKDKKKL